MENHFISIDQIVVKERKRSLRDITQLAESIKELGLLNPITLTKDNVLISGHHRLESCKTLGMTEILVNIVDLDEIKSELAEIDENLIRNELTELEKSEQLARRKELYEQLHPETKKGNAQALGMNRRKGNNVSAESAPTFAEDTAKKTGKSKRAIQESIQISNGLNDSTKQRIKETPIEKKKTNLLRLAKQSHENQQKIIDMFDRGQVNNVQEGINILNQTPLKEKNIVKNSNFDSDNNVTKEEYNMLKEQCNRLKEECKTKDSLISELQEHINELEKQIFRQSDKDLDDEFPFKTKDCRIDYENYQVAVDGIWLKVPNTIDIKEKTYDELCFYAKDFNNVA